MGRIRAMLKRLGLTTLLLGTAWGAFAQEIAQVDSETNWSIYVASNPKECFIVSQPTDSRAMRNGQTVSVRRGDIRLYVTIVPSENIASEPSFLAGYPLSRQQAVDVKIGDDSFAFYPNADTNVEFAWPKPEQDSDVISSMKAGSEAVVTGISTRGTTTVDTFSLLGFTAAMQQAQDRCEE